MQKTARVFLTNAPYDKLRPWPRTVMARHQFDYTFPCSQLLAVDLTAAPNDNS
jgi:hypothetical protein